VRLLQRSLHDVCGKERRQPFGSYTVREEGVTSGCVA